MPLRAFLVTAFLGLASSAAFGGLVYDNGPLNITNGFSGVSITNDRVADDFVLGSSTSVSALRFWLQPNEQLSFGSTISYGVYQNSAGRWAR